MAPQARRARLRDAVAAERPAMVELLQELVRTPSVGGTRAESKLQERLVRDFAASGLETDVWPVPPADLERAPDFSSKSHPFSTRLHGQSLRSAIMAAWRFNGWTTSASWWNRLMPLSLFSPSWASSSKGEP